MTGLPPAASTPSETARAISFRCMCPGMMSLWAQMMPTMGFFISLSDQPSARSSERCDAMFVPFVKVLFMMTSFSSAVRARQIFSL